MKTFISLVCGLILSSLAWGQATIDANTVLNIGESAPVKLGLNFWNPGPAGANQSWDFSAVDHNQDWDWRFYDPAETVFADSFPSANMAFALPVANSPESWSYYRFANDSLQYLGSASILSPTDSTGFYQIFEQNPDLELIFPFTFGTAVSDQAHGIQWVNVGGMTFAQTRDKTTTRTVDAYGDITTPYGTFNNVLRVRTTESIADTLRTLFPVASSQEIVRYTWYSADERYVLMQMDSIATMSFGQPVDINHAHMFRSGEIMTSLEQDRLATKLDLQAFPNPTRARLSIRFQLEQAEKVSLRLSNIIGQDLIREELTYPFIGERQHELDVSMLGAGYYLLSVETEQGVASLKIQIL
ncbi:MAG: T9SS type A sorting domain-containing protein [Bacteroidota bacterium]